MNPLVARGLTKRYRGGAEALRGIDLVLEPGEVFGLLGPNGAGKSTFVRCALDLVRPTSGEVSLMGHSCSDPRSRLGVGYVPEVPRYPGTLTTMELMSLQARLSGAPGAEARIGDLLESAGLDPKMRVASLSKGMLKQLAIAQASLGSPRLLLLDEPTADLDPIGRRMVRDRILDAKSSGAAVLVNSHLLSEVERMCDRVAIMHRGRFIASGSIDSLVPEGTDLESVFIEMVQRADG